MSFENRLIAMQNDFFRLSMSPAVHISSFNIVDGIYVQSEGIKLLPYIERLSIFRSTWKYNNFHSQNDPKGWHEQGRFYYQYRKRDIIWTIDYYDENYRSIVENPLEYQNTKRVLTMMLGPK